MDHAIFRYLFWFHAHFYQCHFYTYHIQIYGLRLCVLRLSNSHKHNMTYFTDFEFHLTAVNTFFHHIELTEPQIG